MRACSELANQKPILRMCSTKEKLERIAFRFKNSANRCIRAYSLLLILIIGNTVGGYEYYLLSNFSAEKSVC